MVIVCEILPIIMKSFMNNVHSRLPTNPLFSILMRWALVAFPLVQALHPTIIKIICFRGYSNIVQALVRVIHPTIINNYIHFRGYSNIVQIHILICDK